ncbi:hypothetical protein GM415_00845 [Pseudodesulfovibrio cashew]|uniref:Uncharacterized protein n=1 Tax=Pseudodesulfovibrio cashew TaxID=2678688 RepID=A0A6I6J864_9BACT|nr:hypothetical protein [Pseudodesulfovibrio cashew]QGY38745.1 hypothetical protein GM415_00845 [Pseudodesulfovibrio cashew]
MTASPPGNNSPRKPAEQRLEIYQRKLRALKDRSSLREVMERELLLKFIEVNHSSINEYPLLPAQQKSVVELLCGRIGHPGYEFIHKHIGDFIVLLVHYEKAGKVGDKEKAAELRARLVNTESMLIKCVQGIVYTMALITDNFEEIVLRHFGQSALKKYSELIEKYELDERFWTAFVEEFVATQVEEAHKEILEGEKFNISKERNFLIIRFLFDDILSKLNPTSQAIDKTRIQKSYLASLEDEATTRRSKLVQSILVKGVSSLPKADTIPQKEFVQAARITCMDPVAQDFEKAYANRVTQAKEQKAKGETPDPEKAKREQLEFKFLMDQVIGAGVGAAIAIGRTSDHFYRAMEEFVPEQISGIRSLSHDFTFATLERILYFLLENHTIHILRETGRSEGGKIQVRSGRARRAPAAEVDALPGMTKIRKTQLFANDVTREDTLLFKPKTAKQMASAMAMLSLEPELQAALSRIWKEAAFRVDIMVLLNLELIAKTTTNLQNKLAEILEKYGVAKRSSNDPVDEVLPS